MTGRPFFTWRPEAQKRKWVELEGQVADGVAARLTTMRSLARQFEATETYDGQTFSLRLMPAPLHRYSDERSGVVDGALFSLANGTNPEVLIQIEARREANDPARWFASTARLSAASLVTQVAGKTEWTADAVGPFEHDPKAAYYAAWSEDPVPE